MAEITLKGRRIPLIFTTLEMKTIQETIAPMSKAISMVLGRNPEDPEDMSRYGGAEHLEAIAQLVVILGNAGLEEDGQAPDLTERKVLRGLKPTELADVINICMDALNEGMASEIPEKKAEGPVNVTLEKINKKKEKES